MAESGGGSKDHPNPNIEPSNVDTDEINSTVEDDNEGNEEDGQEIMRLKDASEKAAMLEAENMRLKAIIDKLEMERDETERQLQEKETKIQELEDDLVRTETQIRVLTIYPDLNGPINGTTWSYRATCIENMEMQAKSYKIRIETLREQSERLARTASSLRQLEQNLKSNKGKTDIHR